MIASWKQKINHHPLYHNYPFFWHEKFRKKSFPVTNMVQILKKKKKNLRIVEDNCEEQLSEKPSQLAVGRLSADWWPIVCGLLPDCGPTDNQLSAKSLHSLLANRWPTVGRYTVSDLSANRFYQGVFLHNYQFGNDTYSFKGSTTNQVYFLMLQCFHKHRKCLLTVGSQP